MLKVDENPNEKSFTFLYKKWVDRVPAVEVLISDITHGGYRTVTQAGVKTIVESIADDAGLKGEDRKNPVKLRYGIAEDYHILLRLANKEKEPNIKTKYVCIDGNHRIVVWRDIMYVLFYLLSSCCC